MYTPKKFKQSDELELVKLITDYPFATLVCVTECGIEANHIPFLLSQNENNDYQLKGHIARVNPLWKTVSDSSSVLAIFHGPQSYISPGFYPTKKEHGKVVPTWNYMTVHVKGEITFIHDTEWKLKMLSGLTNAN